MSGCKFTANLSLKSNNLHGSVIGTGPPFGSAWQQIRVRLVLESASVYLGETPIVVESQRAPKPRAVGADGWN